MGKVSADDIMRIQMLKEHRLECCAIILKYSEKWRLSTVIAVNELGRVQDAHF